MTTYPLSEPATIHDAVPSGDATSAVVGRGTLEECVDIVANFPADRQRSILIQMDEIDLRFGPEEIRELLEFLRAETPGISDLDIAEVKSASL